MHSNPSRGRTSQLALASLLFAALLAPGRGAIRSEAAPKLEVASSAETAWGAQRRLGLCVGWMAATSLATAVGTAAGGAFGGTLIFLALLPPLMDACS